MSALSVIHCNDPQKSHGIMRATRLSMWNSFIKRNVNAVSGRIIVAGIKRAFRSCSQGSGAPAQWHQPMRTLCRPFVSITVSIWDPAPVFSWGHLSPLWFIPNTNPINSSESFSKLLPFHFVSRWNGSRLCVSMAQVLHFAIWSSHSWHIYSAGEEHPNIPLHVALELRYSCFNIASSSLGRSCAKSEFTALASFVISWM